MKNIQKKSLLALIIALSFAGITHTMGEETTTTPMVTSASTQTSSQVTPKQIEQFITMEKGHKDAWINFVKTSHDKKFDLIKKHADEWADFHVAMLGKYNQMMEPGFLTKKLEKMVALHEKQRQEWADLCNANHQAGKQLYEQQTQQLNSFKKSVNLPITAVVPTTKQSASMDETMQNVAEKAEELKSKVQGLGQRVGDWLNKALTPVQPQQTPVQPTE